MTKNEKTSRKVARIASKQLRSKKFCCWKKYRWFGTYSGTRQEKEEIGSVFDTLDTSCWNCSKDNFLWFHGVRVRIHGSSRFGVQGGHRVFHWGQYIEHMVQSLLDA